MAEIVSDENEVPTFRQSLDWQHFKKLMSGNPTKWVKQPTSSASAAQAAARRLRGAAPSPLGEPGEFEIHTKGSVVWGRLQRSSDPADRPELVTATEAFGD